MKNLWSKLVHKLVGHVVTLEWNTVQFWLRCRICDKQLISIMRNPEVQAMVETTQEQIKISTERMGRWLFYGVEK